MAIKMEDLPQEVLVPKVPQPQPEPEIIGRVPMAKGNGGVKDPRDALAKGLLQYDVLKAERDNLDKDLLAARERIRMLEIQLEEIENNRNTIENRIKECLLQRDEAVQKAGELRGVLNSVAAICVRYHDGMGSCEPSDEQSE